MTTYNAAAVADAVIAYQKGITLQQGRALRDNPLAQFESASAAPVNQVGWHPYDSTINGTGSGIAYSFAISGALASFESPTFADGYEYMFLIDQLSSSAAQAFTLELFRETTAAYAATIALTGVVGAASTISGKFVIEAPRKTLKGHYVTGWVDTDPGSNSNASPLAIATVVHHATAQKISKARFAASFDAGIVYMYRRRLDY